MRARRHVGALRTEQPLEPVPAQPRVLVCDRVRCPAQDVLELAQRDLLLGLVPGDRVALAREAAVEVVAGDQQLAALPVETCVDLPHQLAELVALRILREDGEPRLRRPQRQLLPVERQPRREDRVLELVLARCEVGLDDAGLARPAQAVEALQLVSVGRPPRQPGAPRAAPRVKRSAWRATIAACSEVSFSPTRTARTSSAASA